MPLTIYIVSDRNSSKETAVQQQCQGNEPIVSGENGRERASVPQKKFGLLTSLIYDIDCIFPTFSFNFFSCRCAVLGSWRIPVFSSRGAGICWGKPLSGQVKAHFVKLYLSSLSDRSPYDVMGTSLPCKRSHLKRETRHLNLV